MNAGTSIELAETKARILRGLADRLQAQREQLDNATQRDDQEVVGMKRLIWPRKRPNWPVWPPGGGDHRTAYWEMRMAAQYKVWSERFGTDLTIFVGMEEDGEVAAKIALVVMEDVDYIGALRGMLLKQMFTDVVAAINRGGELLISPSRIAQLLADLCDFTQSNPLMLEERLDSGQVSKDLQLPAPPGVEVAR